MEIFNALDLKKGKKAKTRRLYHTSQPLQFISIKDKDQTWASDNLDWLEWNGIRQISASVRRLMKNYKLAEGIIDKSDYIIEENNEMKDIVEQLASDNTLESLELKFFPIIPNIVNVLTNEFAKRDKRVSFRAVDEYTHNEIMENKRQEIEDTLVKHAEQLLLSKLLEEGMDPNDEEVQKMMESKLQPENLEETLPGINNFYAKNYEVLVEKWASKQHLIDEERFYMEELENIAFRDKLITDREFWHFDMLDDDYNVSLWNPVITFYRKSPNVRYISDGDYVGKIEIMTAPDVIDKHGWRMNESQLASLQNHYNYSHINYNMGGLQNDGSFYDATKSHAWNTGGHSLEYRQMISGMEYNYRGNDVLSWILSESEDGLMGHTNMSNTNLFRVTTGYWKSQRKLGHLTKIKENGEVITKIITEEYVVTETPIYNTTLYKNKTTQNLIFGEHIEWIWINHVWGGIKIGPNISSLYGVDNTTGLNPIYLGINQNQIKPLKFQFKGEHSLYGCKLPVEGRVFSDRNTKSTSLVDAMKPFQIGYNIVNNQISDILVDEIGTVIMLDQNTLPKHSLGEDWGKGNLAKAYVAMKDFSMLPLDTSIANTENPLNFQHFQQLDLSQTQRLMSRVQLAQFFKQQAFEQVGVSPQRMGQPLGQKVSATEVEQTQVGSYAQTEHHFIDHSDYLMPRVHQMRTDLSQWYNSTKPSVRLQHTNSLDERINFEINGEDLLMRDLNVFCTTKANHRKVLEEMKNLAVNNNTAGATIYDLGKILQTDSLGSLESTLKEIETKMQKEKEAERKQQEKMQQEILAQQEKEKAMELDHEAQENEKERRKDILVAEIRASGFGAMQDINENNQSDFIDNMEKLKQTEQYQETINIQKDKVNENRKQHSDKMNFKREEMSLKRELKEKDLQIAKENKNQYDFKKTKESKKK